MDGGRGEFDRGGGREGTERVVDFLGFSIFGNNMNQKPGEQKLHRKGRDRADTVWASPR